MTPSSSNDLALRPLSESEIQEQLYGEYHAGFRRRVRASAPAVSPTPVPRRESPWTGEEILRSELKRLTRELTTLQREKEHLVAVAGWRRLGWSPRLIRPMARLRTLGSEFVAAATNPSTTWIVLGFSLLASALLGRLYHAVALEAYPTSPKLAAGGLYSVQVGVYEVKPLAQQLVDTLSRQGHPAFLVEFPSRRGKSRYRVYVGRYGSRATAQEGLKALRQYPFLADSFILQRKDSRQD